MKLRDWIIKETENWIVLNKPSGLLSIPDREGKEMSLKILLQQEYKNIFTVHRLDRDTSGLIVFAKNETSHKHLSLQFEGRQTEKIYTGFVCGVPINKKGSVLEPIVEHQYKKGFMIIDAKGKPSHTDYEVLEDFGIYSWVRFKIHTGRTHQIRVHAGHLGHPVVCDVLYGDGKPVFLSSFKPKFKLSKGVEEERPLLNRLALHAYRLKFQDLNGNTVDLEAPFPKDLAVTLLQLNKWKNKPRKITGLSAL